MCYTRRVFIMDEGDSTMNHSATRPRSATTLLRPYVAHTVACGRVIALFLYGDDTRTRRSLLVAYGFIAAYVLASMHAQSIGACTL